MLIHYKYVYYNRLNQLLLFLQNETESEERISFAWNGPQMKCVKQKRVMTDVQSVLTANDLFFGDVKETTNSCNFCKKYNENGTNTVGTENWSPSTGIRNTWELPFWEISGNSIPLWLPGGKSWFNNERVTENNIRKGIFHVWRTVDNPW